MSNRRDTQFIYTPHLAPVKLDCEFTVASADAAGFGVNALNKSGRISSLFMHTSATPGKASNGLTNPNPVAGMINVNLQDNYNVLYNVHSTFTSPLSGTSISISTAGSLTVGNPYVITAVGTTTQAQWVAVGLPAYIPAAVGVSFYASATAGAGTGTVQAPAAAGAGIDHIEIVGNPSIMNSSGSNIMGFGVGMTINLACYKNGVLTAPTNGTIIGLEFYLNKSGFGV